MLDYDAIFIGAGHNALACAAHLSRKGWRVGLFEASETPGGAVRTAELTLPGFLHDFGAMNLSQFSGSGFYKEFEAELTNSGLAFVRATDCFASVFPDGRWLGVSTDLDRTAERIALISKRDAETWRQLAAEFPKRSGPLFALLASSMKKRALASVGYGAWRSLGVSGSLDLARFLLSSSREWLDETFESPEVKAMTAAWGMHADFAPDVAGGALFPYLESMIYQSFGMVIGQGGADTVIKALCAMVQSAGGHIECNATVERIETNGTRATAVILADGRRIEARRAVIGSVAPRSLARLLPEGTGEARFDQGMAQYRHAPGTMMIHLALDDLPAWPDAALHKFAYVHLAPSLDVMALAYQQAQAGLLPTEPVIVVGQPTAIDPSRAPEGKHVLWMQVRMVPGQVQGDAQGRIKGTDWSAIKETFADRAIAIVERYAPGLQKRILARTVFSPLDLEAVNRNLVGGDQICGSHHIYQNFLFRPVRGYADWQTPLKGLYLIGAASWPGAGVGAGSGYGLARILAKR